MSYAYLVRCCGPGDKSAADAKHDKNAKEEDDETKEEVKEEDKVKEEEAKDGNAEGKAAKVQTTRSFPKILSPKRALRRFLAVPSNQPATSLWRMVRKRPRLWRKL